MKRISLLATAALALVATTACGGFVRGSGEIATETREVSGFDGVELRGSGDLTISIGEETSLVVEADSALIDRITTEVVDGRLVIDEEVNRLFGVDGTHFQLTLPSLEEVELSGSGTVTASDLAGDLVVEVGGSGEVDVSGDVDRLEIDIDGSGSVDASALTASSATVGGEGSGDIDVVAEGARLDAFVGGSISIRAEGRVDVASVEIEGSGTFSGRQLTAAAATIDISGSGTVELAVDEELAVTISGSGNVTYYGNPDVTRDISGSGGVNQG